MVDLGDNELYTAGAMRIAQESFDDGMGVRTLIHEASHKYAGTIDYCYLSNEDQIPRGVFNEKSRALINADSYAWFVLKVAGSKW